MPKVFFSGFVFTFSCLTLITKNCHHVGQILRNNLVVPARHFYGRQVEKPCFNVQRQILIFRSLHIEVNIKSSAELEKLVMVIPKSNENEQQAQTENKVKFYAWICCFF